MFPEDNKVLEEDKSVCETIFDFGADEIAYVKLDHCLKTGLMWIELTTGFGGSSAKVELHIALAIIKEWQESWL